MPGQDLHQRERDPPSGSSDRQTLEGDLELMLVAGDSDFKPSRILDALDDRGVDGLIVWRRLKGRENSPDVLTVKDRIDAEGSEHKRAVHKRLQTMAKSFIGRVRCRLAYGRLTQQELENVGIHVSVILCMVYAVAIVVSHRQAGAMAERRLLHLTMGWRWK